MALNSFLSTVVISPAILLPIAFIGSIDAHSFALRQEKPIVKPSAKTGGPQLQGESVVIPLVLVKGFPFIEGSINSKKGKIMFDVGDQEALVIDSSSISPPNGVVVGKGFFGSGQSFDVYKFPLIKELTLANKLRYTNLENVFGNSGLPIKQDITSDFIGWLGVAFFKGYVFKLDYSAPSASFYKSGEKGVGESAALKGEQVKITISLESKGHEEVPTFPMMIGEINYIASLDTGSHNTIWGSESEFERIKKAGTLRKTGKSWMLHTLKINGKPLDPLPVNLVYGKAPVAKLLPTPETPFITLGYGFLAQYKTVWNLEQGTVKVLNR